MLSRSGIVVFVSCFFIADVSPVQSAFARNVLNHQLLALALFNPSEQGRTALDIVFNDGPSSSQSYYWRSLILVHSMGK